MKKIRYIFLIAIGLATANSCSDDSFPVPPASTVPNYTFTITNDAFAPATVTFTNTSIVPERAGAVTYTWNFGDGTTSTELNPVHEYTVPGNYKANLVVVTGNSMEIKQSTQTVFVKDPNATGVPLFFTNGQSVFSALINTQGPVPAPLTGVTLQKTYGLAVDTVNGKVYMADAAAESIMVSDLDGKNLAVFRSNIGETDGVAIDYANKHIYWDTSEGIRRANMEDTDVNQYEDFTTGHPDDPEGIAIDPVTKAVFWNTYDGDVWTKKMDGTGEKSIFTSLGGGSVIVVGDRIYFDTYLSAGDISLLSSNFDGSGIETVATGITRLVYGIGYEGDGKKIYWIDRDLKKIMRANLDGTETELWLETESEPRGIAIGKKK